MSKLSRDQMLALDHAGGMKFRDCSDKYGLDPSRCHQIYTKVVAHFRLSQFKVLPASRLATAIIESKRPQYKGGTPEGMYNQIEYEKERDAETRRLNRLQSKLQQESDF